MTTTNKKDEGADDVLDELTEFQLNARRQLSDQEAAILDLILDELNKNIGDGGKVPDSLKNELKKSVEANFRTQEKRG